MKIDDNGWTECRYLVGSIYTDGIINWLFKNVSGDDYRWVDIAIEDGLFTDGISFKNEEDVIAFKLMFNTNSSFLYRVEAMK